MGTCHPRLPLQVLRIPSTRELCCSEKRWSVFPPGAEVHVLAVCKRGKRCVPSAAMSPVPPKAAVECPRAFTGQLSPLPRPWVGSLALPVTPNNSPWLTSANHNPTLPDRVPRHTSSHVARDGVKWLDLAGAAVRVQTSSPLTFRHRPWWGGWRPSSRRTLPLYPSRQWSRLAFLPDWFFMAKFCGSQSERRVVSCTGPFSPQLLPAVDPLSGGDSCLCLGWDLWRGLSLVLSDAYFHILIQSQMDVLCVAGQGVSVSGAPLWAVTRVTRELVLHVRLRAMQVHMYLDDLLILADSHD